MRMEHTDLVRGDTAPARSGRTTRAWLWGLGVALVPRALLGSGCALGWGLSPSIH